MVFNRLFPFIHNDYNANFCSTTYNGALICGSDAVAAQALEVHSSPRCISPLTLPPQPLHLSCLSAVCDAAYLVACVRPAPSVLFFCTSGTLCPLRRTPSTCCNVCVAMQRSAKQPMTSK